MTLYATNEGPDPSLQIRRMIFAFVLQTKAGVDFCLCCDLYTDAEVDVLYHTDPNYSDTNSLPYLH